MSSYLRGGVVTGAAWVVMLTAVLPVQGEEAARPTQALAEDLPASWANVPPAGRLAAKRAAEVDAKRLLAERIYGLSLSGGTTVQDLALEADEIRVSLDALIRGVRTTELKPVVK